MTFIIRLILAIVVYLFAKYLFGLLIGNNVVNIVLSLVVVAIVFKKLIITKIQ